MIIAFARPSVGARVATGNVIQFGPASQGQAPLPATVGTGFQNPITTATHPRLLRFGFAPQGTAGAVVARRAVGSLEGEGGGRRRRITREELDRRLKEQRDNTFGRRWFEEFQAAEQEVREAAALAKKKAARKALETAARAVAEIAPRLDEQTDLVPITLALEAAADATKLKDTLAAAKRAVELLKAELQRLDDEEEDEVATLLLMS